MRAKAGAIDELVATGVLDDGAAGVIVPYVEKPEVVRQMAGATKLRPLKGERVRRALDGETLEPELRDYIDNHNSDHILLTNIESVPAMENLDQILEEQGIRDSSFRKGWPLFRPGCFSSWRRLLQRRKLLFGR